MAKRGYLGLQARQGQRTPDAQYATFNGFTYSHRCIMEAIFWTLQLPNTMNATRTPIRRGSKKYGMLKAIFNAQVPYSTLLETIGGRCLKVRGPETNTPRRLH